MRCFHVWGPGVETTHSAYWPKLWLGVQSWDRAQLSRLGAGSSDGERARLIMDQLGLGSLRIGSGLEAHLGSARVFT